MQNFIKLCRTCSLAFGFDSFIKSPDKNSQLSYSKPAKAIYLVNLNSIFFHLQHLWPTAVSAAAV